MFRFAVLVAARLALVAPVALDAALEVVVLALTADPAAVGEIKVLLHCSGSLGVGRANTSVAAQVESATAQSRLAALTLYRDVLLIGSSFFLRLLLTFLVLAPFGAAGVILLSGFTATVVVLAGLLLPWRLSNLFRLCIFARIVLRCAANTEGS